MQVNRGITQVIMCLLDKRDAAFLDEIFKYCTEYFPTLTRKQLGGILSSLKRRGKILHICPRTYACLDYPNR